MESFETLLKESFESLLQQIDARLVAQQQLLEFHMGAPPSPEVRTTPLANPGKDLTAFQVNVEISEESPKEVAVAAVAPKAPKAAPKEAPKEAPKAPAAEEELSNELRNGEHSGSERSPGAPNSKKSMIGDARGSKYFKPARQDSYELAQEAESSSGGGDKIATGISTPVLEVPEYLRGRPFRSRLAGLVSSVQFESFFAVLIGAHAVLLGAQIEWECLHLQQSLPPELTVTNVIFNLIFLVEIILRITAFGPKDFFKGASWGWNLVDFGLALIALVEILVDAVLEDTFNSGSFRILRILRLARSARGLRIVRLLRFIRPLRLLVFSIAITLKSLVWSIILLFIIIYLFSILFADANLSYFTTGGHTPPTVLTDTDLQTHFGSVNTSMHTLFRAIAGGLEWRHASRSLEDSIGWGWAALFTMYIAFCCFAVLNVMTGVFCHSAITGAEQDHEIMVQSMVNEQERIKAAFGDLFHLMDKDGSGTITIKEFEKGFQVQTTKALFEALGLKAEDAWTLFRSLDKDGDHRVGSSEFVQGCIHIRGPARQVDLRRQAQTTRSQLDNLESASFEAQVLLKEMAHAMDIDPQNILQGIKSQISETNVDELN